VTTNEPTDGEITTAHAASAKYGKEFARGHHRGIVDAEDALLAKDQAADEGSGD
jgi:hypothetical protein